MVKLAIQLLGRVAVHDGAGAEVPVPPGKVRALLAYLAQRPGRAYSRAHLATLLWGDREEAPARHNLSQALTTLRRALGSVVGPMSNDPEMLALDATGVDVDVVRLRSLAEEDSQEALSQAVRLYADPLPGLNVPQPDFQNWLATRRAELRELGAELYERLLARVLADGDQGRAVQLAKELLEVDPASEFGHRILIDAHFSQGNIPRATEQYQTCRRRLQEELGVAPSEETEKLAASLFNIDPASPPGGNPGVVLAPVETHRTIDSTALQGLVADVAAELLRLHSVEAAVSPVSIGADPGGAAAQLGAERGFPYGLAIELQGRAEKACLSATLVRTEDAGIVWQSTHELEFAEIFNPGVVASPVRHHVERDWLDRARQIPEQDWSAYTHFMRGTALYFEQWNAPENWARALTHFDKALALGVSLTQARARRDSIRAHNDIWLDRDDVSKCEAAFLDVAHHALQVDPAEPNVHRMLSMDYLHRRKFNAAYQQFSRGLRENPNDANLNIAFTRYLTHIGKPERALVVARRARQLNPVHPDYYWEQLGVTLYALERHKDALTAFQRIDRLSYYEHLYMAASQVALEQRAAAGRSLERALAQIPELRASRMDRLMPYYDEEIGRRLHCRLLKAGLPR